MATSIDEAMAGLSVEQPSGKSEPEVTTTDEKPVAAGTAQGNESNTSGSAGSDKPAPETDKKEVAVEDKTPKSAYAFQKLKDRMRKRDSELENLTKAIEQLSGVPFDREKSDIQAYMQIILQKNELEKSKAKLEADEGVNEAMDELRDAQAEELLGYDKSSMELYNKLKGNRKVLYSNIGKLDPSGVVADYMKHSDRSVLLELAFQTPQGQELFDKCLTDNDYQTRRNLERLEDQFERAVKANAAKQETKQKLMDTPSVNDGSAVTQTKTGPSLKEVAGWYK